MCQQNHSTTEHARYIKLFLDTDRILTSKLGRLILFLHFLLAKLYHAIDVQAHLVVHGAKEEYGKVEGYVLEEVECEIDLEVLLEAEDGEEGPRSQHVANTVDDREARY